MEAGLFLCICDVLDEVMLKHPFGVMIRVGYRFWRVSVRMFLIHKRTGPWLESREGLRWCVARSEKELLETGLEYIVADLGTVEGCVLTVEETEKRFGPVDIFVCNHGIGSAHEQVIWKQELATWNETMQINLDGPFYLSRPQKKANSNLQLVQYC